MARPRVAEDYIHRVRQHSGIACSEHVQPKPRRSGTDTLCNWCECAFMSQVGRAGQTGYACTLVSLARWEEISGLRVWDLGAFRGAWVYACLRCSARVATTSSTQELKWSEDYLLAMLASCRATKTRPGALDAISRRLFLQLNRAEPQRKPP